MNVHLDRIALLDAMNAFWEAETPGNDKGIEAAIVAYLTRMRLARHHETVLAENERMRSRSRFFRLPTDAIQAAE